MSNAYVPLLPDSNASLTRAMVETLEAFELPFIWYGDGHRVVHVSAGARSMLGRAQDPQRALGEISQAVARALTQPLAASGAPRGFQQLGDLPSLREIGSVAMHRPAPPMAGVAAVVVLRSADSETAGEFMSRLLTRRELEVAHLIAAGAPNKEVAARLGISSHTARHHTERVYEKLSVRNRVSLARLVADRSAVRAGR